MGLGSSTVEFVGWMNHENDEMTFFSFALLYS